MQGRILFVAGAAVGYVLGARAGRRRYEQIKAAATRVRTNPQVQQKTQQAVDLAKEQAPVVKDKLGDTLSGAAEAAKAGCPVSKALAGTTITLDARLA